MTESYITWNGHNTDEVRSWLRDRCGFEFPADWVEELPGESLFLMCDTDAMFVDKGRSIFWDKGKGPRLLAASRI